MLRSSHDLSLLFCNANPFLAALAKVFFDVRTACPRPMTKPKPLASAALIPRSKFRSGSLWVSSRNCKFFKRASQSYRLGRGAKYFARFYVSYNSNLLPLFSLLPCVSSTIDLLPFSGYFGSWIEIANPSRVLRKASNLGRGNEYFDLLYPIKDPFYRPFQFRWCVSSMKNFLSFLDHSGSLIGITNL